MREISHWFLITCSSPVFQVMAGICLVNFLPFETSWVISVQTCATKCSWLTSKMYLYFYFAAALFSRWGRCTFHEWGSSRTRHHVIVTEITTASWKQSLQPVPFSRIMWWATLDYINHKSHCRNHILLHWIWWYLFILCFILYLQLVSRWALSIQCRHYVS